MNANLTTEQQDALLTLSLMAAFADGRHEDLEREELKRLAATLPGGEASGLYQRVLLRQVTVAEAAAPLVTPELRQLGYEMAVCVCDADDVLNDAEKTFLEMLRGELGLAKPTAAAFQADAETVARTDLTAPPIIPQTSTPILQTGLVNDAEVEKTILNYSILNGALELLPETISTMAIVPLQMKMVYGIGKRYGFELDRKSIGELLGAAGVGLTSQVVEGFARKLLGGLLGKVGGGVGRTLGNQAASSAMSFASTYALGQVAQRYYAGGRRLSTAQLREAFGSLTGQARALHGQYAGQILDRARSINPAQMLSSLRNGSLP